MFNIKKDWLYESRVTYLGFVLAQLIFIVCGVLLSRYELAMRIITQGFYESFSEVSIIVVLIYPLYVLKVMSPRRNRLLSANPITAGFPYSKKQIFWKAIKPWIYLAPLYIIIQIAIFYFLEVIQLGVSIDSFYYQSLFSILLIIPLILALVLQGIAAIIVYLSQNIKWYKLVSAIVIGNLCYIFSMVRIMELMNIDMNSHMNWLFTPMVLLLIISVIIFTMNFNKIEKIWQ